MFVTSALGAVIARQIDVLDLVQDLNRRRDRTVVVPIGSNTHRSGPAASISDGTHTRTTTSDSRPNGAGEERPT